MATVSRWAGSWVVIFIAALSFALAPHGFALAKDSEEKQKRSSVQNRTEKRVGKHGRTAVAKSNRAASPGKKSTVAQGKAADKKGQASPKSRAGTARGGTRKGTFTAYTSRASEGAGNPNITADGTNLEKKSSSSCTVANNALPMGTKVEVEGIGTCVVRDRLGGKAAADRFDIHLKDDPKWAKAFGKRTLNYKIVGAPEKS
jgi:3D (Asp-Asp-Asp) domain-containing protein